MLEHLTLPQLLRTIIFHLFIYRLRQEIVDVLLCARMYLDTSRYRYTSIYIEPKSRSRNKSATRVCGQVVKCGQPWQTKYLNTGKEEKREEGEQEKKKVEPLTFIDFI